MTIADPWAPIDSALAQLEHRQRAKAAEARQAARLSALRAEWLALTEAERLEIWGGEESTRFLDLPEFMTYGKDAA